MDRNTILSIFGYERQPENMQTAVDTFLQWLTTLKVDDSIVLTTLLDALRSDTEEHKNLHNMLCVSTVYLPVHQHLVNTLARRLQDKTVKMRELLHLLKSLRLLEPEWATNLLDMAKSSDNNEKCVQVASFLLVCLYANIAKVLGSIENENSQDQMSTAEEEHPINCMARTGADNRIAAIRAKISALVSDEPNTRKETENRDETGQPEVHPHSATNQTHDETSDHIIIHWMQNGGAIWARVLEKVIGSMPGECNGQHYTLNDNRCKQLWDSASGLINAIYQRNVDEAEELESEDVNDSSSETSSRGSQETVKATDDIQKDMGNLSVNKRKHIEKFLDSKPKMHNICDYPGSVQDEVTSLCSIETNSRQKERRPELTAGQTGVLRAEEVKLLRAGIIQLRPYQEELLMCARQGENVLIWLPTGTGKTYIVLKYAEDHLKGSAERRVGFIVPKVRLARQQYERFQAYMPQFKPYLRCGETSGTASNKQPLRDVLQTNKVVVMTGQSLVEAVDSNKVSLDQFTVLVLDECHHTRGGHPLRSLMNQYMELKFSCPNTKAKLPQIIGLTASPGVGKARSRNHEEAVNYLKQLCARLDVSRICRVNCHIAELQKYANVPRTVVRECKKREEDRLRSRIEMLMECIETSMTANPDVTKYLDELNHEDQRNPESLMLRLRAPVTQRGQEQYTQWLSTAEKVLTQVNNQTAFYALNAHFDLLKLCQRCLILNEDCDSLGALELLKEEVEMLKKDKPDLKTVDHDLFGLFEKYTSYITNSEMCSIENECKHPKSHNPKLKLLEDMIMEASGDYDLAHVISAYKASKDRTELAEKDEDCTDADTVDWSDSISVTSDEQQHLEQNIQGMIFVKTLDLTKALVKWMKRHPKLKCLNPGRITGVNASVTNGGMTKSEVSEVMAKFNAGIHKMVICTSAAEEGLDFKACNLVIRYLYEASMVTMIQTRGRAREQNSSYCVMARESTDSVSKEFTNQQSEMTMNRAILSIENDIRTNPRNFKYEIERLQQSNWSNRWKKDVQEAKILRQRLPEGMYRLRCKQCSEPACTSQEIRLLRKTNRVVIGAEFCNKYERKDDTSTEKKVYDSNIPRTGKLHCKKCGYYWGIIVRSLPEGVEFPIIPIKSFITEDSSNQKKYIEKWSKAFDVPEITEEDILRHTEPLLGPSDRLEGDFDREMDEQEAETAQSANGQST